MASTDWIHELKVADLKEELKKRGQPVAGKKAELAARLEEYVKEHEAGSAEAEPAAGAAESKPAAGAEEATKEAEPAAEEATVAAAEPELPAAAETAAAPVEEAKASPADDIDLDYGESEDEQPQQQTETKPVEKAATAPSQQPDEQEQEKKAEPESRKRPNSSTEPTSEEASRPEKQAKTEAAQLFLKKQDQPESESGAEPTAATAAAVAAKPQGSRALRIEGFVRPFTENQARTLLSQSGTITAMWMPSIRNVAWVVYSTKSEAETAKTALFKLQWPAGSPRVLMPASVSVHAAEKAIRIGSNNPEFKIERTEEDGPDEPEGMEDVAGGHPYRQQQHAADDEILKDASPLRVKDLRELLSRKSTGGSGIGERKRRDPVPNLDELFRKTTAKPAIYWLPLSEEAVDLKKKAKAAIAGAGGRGGKGRNGGRGGR